MSTAKETYRDVKQDTKKTLRDADGHDVTDDIGNAGDEIRKDLGNAGDEMRRDVGNAEYGVRRGDKPADWDDPNRTDRPLDDPWK